MDQKETYQTSKKINRTGLSFIFGIVFHYLYAAANIHYCTLATFVPLLVLIDILFD